MGVITIDGRVRVAWCTAIANINAPTVAEINAGVQLEGYITPDGLNITASTNAVKTSNLGSTFTTQKAGRRAYDVSIVFHHDGPGSDVAWNLFPYRTNGYLVVRMGLDKTTAWTAGQQVKVYPLESGEPTEAPPAEDALWDFTSPFFLTADPQTRAVIA